MKSKNPQAHQEKMESRVIKAFSKCLEKAKIKFAERYNALYDMNHFIAILLTMVELGITAEEAALYHAKENMPSRKWFQNMMKSISFKDAEKLCKKLIQISVKFAMENALVEDLRFIAVDKHNISRYDKADTEYLICSKPKNGTSKFEGYASMQAVGGKINSILGCMFLKKIPKTWILCVNSCMICHDTV